MDREVIEKAAILARRTVERGRESLLLPYFQFCTGMAEYRLGNLAAADAVLAAIKPDRKIRGLEAAHFYRAMIALRQNRPDDARRHLGTGLRDMQPLPVDDRAPLDAGGDHDDLISWLAYREARTMLDGTK
jgi:hypothetical protein